MHEATAATQQVATFFVSDLFFGVPVGSVQEVLLAQRMARVPLAPNTIRGLINLRGQIVTALDVAALLQIPPRDETLEPMNVVLRGVDGGAVSLLVDDIGEVLDVNTAELETPPPHVPERCLRVTKGVHKADGKLLLLLDTKELLRAASDRAGTGTEE